MLKALFGLNLVATNVIVRLPTPGNTSRVKVAATVGKAKYKGEEGAIIWKYVLTHVFRYIVVPCCSLSVPIYGARRQRGLSGGGKSSAVQSKDPRERVPQIGCIRRLCSMPRSMSIAHWLCCRLKKFQGEQEATLSAEIDLISTTDAKKRDANKAPISLQFQVNQSPMGNFGQFLAFAFAVVCNVMVCTHLM